jgi:phage terminase large subunit
VRLNGCSHTQMVGGLLTKRFLATAARHAAPGAGLYATVPPGPLLVRFIAGFGEGGFDFRHLLVYPVFAHKPRPYVTNRRWVYEVLHEYGEESAYWQARVRGQFPTEAEDALISLAWIEAAQRNLGSSIRRDHQGNVIDLGRDKLFVGADVAGPGRDETVIVVRNEQGQVVDTFACHGDSRGPVARFLMPYKPRIVEMNCDEIGVGLYWTPHFEELGYPAEGINVGRNANDEARFANLKAEYYWRLRENFRDGQIGGIVDPIMASQLASIRYRPNAKGKIEIESKDDLKKRGVKSPDRAEALMLAFARWTPGILDYYRELVEGRSGH